MKRQIFQLPSRLEPENIDARFNRRMGLGSIFWVNLEGPYQPHHGEAAGNQDLLDVEGIMKRSPRIAQRAAQQFAQRMVIALGLALVIGDKVRGKKAAYFARIAGVEFGHPGLQRGSYPRLRAVRGLRPQVGGRRKHRRRGEHQRYYTDAAHCTREDWAAACHAVIRAGA